MPRKPDPVTPFFDVYAPFVNSLQEYSVRAGMLQATVESAIPFMTDGIPIPEVVIKRLQDACDAMKTVAYGK